jgi:hypothetical protein
MKQKCTIFRLFIFIAVVLLSSFTSNAQQTFYSADNSYWVTFKISAVRIVPNGGTPCDGGPGYNYNLEIDYEILWQGNLANVQINNFRAYIRADSINGGTVWPSNQELPKNTNNGKLITGTMYAGNNQYTNKCPANKQTFGVNRYCVWLEAYRYWPNPTNLLVGSSSNNGDCYYIDNPTRKFVSVKAGNFSDPTMWNYWQGGVLTSNNTTVFPTSADSVSITHDVVQDVDYVVSPAKTMVVSSNVHYTIAAGKSLRVSGGADFNNAAVTIKSDSTGTGRIAKSTGTISNLNNLTVERYIPLKYKRKWTLLATPVQQSFRNGWQQSIFITGPGTGGTPCGPNSGNGGSTDKYNSNGFDDTQNDPSTVFTYSNTAVGGTYWTPIANTTGTDMVPGVGYRVNVRGDRNKGATACQDQINYFGNSPATSDVTLKATGAYVSSASVTLNSNNKYSLVGNPFPCELSFPALYNENNAKILNKGWLYAGTVNNTNDQYSTWNSGQFTGVGFPIGYYISGSDLIIPSGAAFFVERSGGGNLQFSESTKSDSVRSGNNIFSRSANAAWTDYVRVYFNQVGNTDTEELDNIIIRYSDDSSVNNQTYGDLDSYSFNSATTSLSSLKGTGRMSIQTRRLDFTSDTVWLSVANTLTGNYQLKAAEFEAFAKAGNIYLLDKYLGTVTNLKIQPVYNFQITSDPLSQGSTRFAIVFKTMTTLPVNFVNITAARKESRVKVAFATASEVNVKDFTLERSTNGSVFTTTGVVIAATGAGVYEASDNNALAAATYYRIKATDNDGKVMYSNMAKVDKTAASLQVNVYPNPVKNELHVSLFGATANAGYTLRILSLNGSQLQQQTGNVQAGVINIDASRLSAGVYIAQVVLNSGEVIAKQFVKQ